MAFDVGAIVARLELDKKKWEQSIAAVKKDQTSLQGFVLRNEQQIKSLGRTLTVGGALVTGFFGLIMKGAINAGDYINDLSKRTGVGTETLSAYKLAADKSGTSLEGLAIGMRGLANQMQAANSGGKESQKIFKALGVEYVDNTGKLRPLDQVMLDVADRFAQMEDGAQKTALAQDIFGRSGMELIPMLNMGRKGLEENAAAARKLGIVWSTEAARKADEFNDALVELKAGLAGTGREIATALMPMVKSLIEKVRDIAIKVREWIAEHPALTSWITKLTLGAGLLAGALGPILMMLPGLIKGFQVLQASTIATTFGGITLAIMGAYAAFKLLIALRDDWERKTGHFVDKETKAWADLTYSLGGWSTFAEAATRQHIATMSELTAIWDKYGQNTSDTLKAIAKGDEGPALKKLLEELAGKHLDVAIAASEQKKSYDGLIPSVKSLAEELGIITRVKVEEKLDKMRQALILYKGKLTTDEEKKLREEIEKLEKQLDPDTVRAFGNLAIAGEEAASDLNFVWNLAWKDIRTSSDEATLKAAEDMIANFKWGGEKAAEEMVENTRSFMQEVSTIVSDAMRDIAEAFVGLFNFKKLFGAMTIDIKFDSSAFDGMVDAANSAYDKITDASRRSFDAQELQISRAEQDEDIRYRREYDNKRKAIEDSSKTQKQKDAMLEALEIQYESAKLAREREREDARYVREEAQAKKLLQLQWDHEADLDKIRKAEDLARQKLADDELKRQDSLWFKVKGIFATAVEEMLTIWLTKFIANIAESILGIGTSIAKSLKGAAESVAGAVGGIAQGASGAISGMWTALGAAVGTFVGTVLGNLIGGGPSGHQQQQQINDTKDSRNFLAEIRNWFVSAGSGFGGAAYSFITGHLLDKFDGLKGSLDLTRDQMIPRLDKIVEYTALLKKIQFGQHGLDTTVSRPTMFMAGERGPERVTISPNFRISSTPIHVHVHMDGKQVALVTAKYAPELSRDGALKIHERGLIRN